MYKYIKKYIIQYFLWIFNKLDASSYIIISVTI